MKSLLILILSVSCINATGQRTEHMRNGGFDNSDHWTITGGWSISNGSARYSTAGGYSFLRQTNANLVVSLIGGRTYTLKFDIESDGVAQFDIHPYVNPVAESYSNGSHAVEFTVPADKSGADFYLYTYPTGSDFIIDNISLTIDDLIGDDPYYVSTMGDDQNTGSYAAPWATWEKAAKNAYAGDTVIFRGGVYYLNSSINLDTDNGTANSGERGNRIAFMGDSADLANGDSAIFDFSNNYVEEPDYAGIEAVPKTASNRNNAGIVIYRQAHVLYKNFVVRNVYQKYRYVNVHGFILGYSHPNTTIENITVHTIGGPGFYINGLNDTTYIYNCDAYHCIDSFSTNPTYYNLGEVGTYAHGFNLIKNTTSTVFEVDGCRAWLCADDGWNNTGPGRSVMSNNWSFLNGVTIDGWQTSGNGYKINTSANEGEFDKSDVQHIVYNCIAAFNVGYGYTENSNNGESLNRRIYNNIAYKNQSVGFIAFQPGYIDGGWENNYKNNLSYNNDGGNVLGESYMHTNEYNSWNAETVVSISDADFMALPKNAAHTLAILSAPRQADGSLPSLGNYFKLAPNSGLINKGTDVGLPYSGIAPDLGPIESGTISVEIVNPERDKKIIKGDSMFLKARAHDTIGPVDQVFFIIEGQDEPIGIAEKKTSDKWEYPWENISKIGYHALRAKATNFNNDTATSQRIRIDIDDNGEIESCCHLVYDKDSINPKLQFMEPLKENPNLIFLSVDGVIIHAETYYIKDISNEIEIDLSIFDPGIHLIVALNVNCCLPQKLMKL